MTARTREGGETIEHPAQPLIDRMLVDVEELMSDLEGGDMTATAWRDDMAATLARGHLAAFMAGQESSELDQTSMKRLLADVTKQLSFLDNFTVEIQAAAEFQKGWNARAQLYVEQTGASYYAGKFKMWALPDMPRSGGTACLGRCSCSWDVQEQEGEGNALAYWRLGPSDHCQQCVERAQQWSPLTFKNGELQ